VKTLLVLRHAKSSWKDDTLDDHDRPLHKRGKKMASLMGKLIAEQNAVPDLILSSTARRARSTAKRAAKAMVYKGDIIYRQDLYLAEPRAYFKAIRECANTQDRVMTIGHNPGLESLVQTMTGTDKPLPTAALAAVELTIQSWKSLKRNTKGKLGNLWLPREQIDHS
jgi:phosphohistidine phosphatase